MSQRSYSPRQSSRFSRVLLVIPIALQNSGKVVKAFKEANRIVEDIYRPGRPSVGKEEVYALATLATVIDVIRFLSRPERQE